MLLSHLRSLCAPNARPSGKVSSKRKRSARSIRTNSARRDLVLEALEERSLLTVVGPSVIMMHPGLTALAGAGQPAGLSPAQVRHAYGFDQITFNNGAVVGNGAGQTIAIVDAYDQPNLAGDLAAFDAAFGLPAPPSFAKVNQNGGTALPAANASWGLEESLDVEWAHAIAPGAKILLVEANSASFTDLITAVNYARNQPGVSVVSMSFGGGEWSGESAYDSYFTTPAGHAGVTFVASSGDSGSAGSPESPSVSPNVLAVGGTQLSVDASGNYLSEIAWSGSGGGISQYENQPAYQKGVVTQTTTKRTVPDVAYDGSGGSPFAVYDTYGNSGWLQVYGTSAGAPQWAALVAIADQGRALAGKASLDGATQTLSAIYQLPSADFHDITGGSNGGYSASAGYDLVTGRGTPRANLVVSGLVGGISSTPTPPPPTPPTVVTPARASASPVTGTSTVLSVLGTDAAGAASLTYTWTMVSGPAGVVTPSFSTNGTNGAQNVTATFRGVGTYVFQVTLRDPAGLTAVSSVTVTVNPTQTYLILTPGNLSLADGKSQQFKATAEDQFGVALSKQPTWSWSIISGAGYLTSAGVYTAPSSGRGTAVIRVTGGNQALTATVAFAPPLPSAPTRAAAAAVNNNWLRVSWQDNSTNELGFLVQRSTNGGPWTTVGATGANVTFFNDTRVSAANHYVYRVVAYNAAGQSTLSNVTTSVKPGTGTRAVAAATVAPAAGPAAVGAFPAAGIVSSLQPAAREIVNALVGQLALQNSSGHNSSASDALWQSFGTNPAALFAL